MPPDIYAPNTDTIVGALLAGGLARRMGGGDKCLRQLAGRPLLSHIIEQAQPQVGHLILNANGDPARFEAFGLAVVADEIEGFAGPLAGVLAAMHWTQRHLPRAGWIASFPTDAPFLPTDLVTRLYRAAMAEGAPLACAASAGRSHPVVGLWRLDLADDLRRALVDEGLRKIDLWTQRHSVVEVAWPTDPIDPFLNVNRPEDLVEAERLLG